MINDLAKFKKVHFIGIGGVLMSAVASILKNAGVTVSGSDLELGATSDLLQSIGIEVKKGHSKENLSEDTDLVIYTLAIPEDNPEYKKAKELRTPMLTVAEAIKLLSKDKRTIVVSGTHGKTTTTSVLAKCLIDNGFDPTITVGSILKEQKTNAIVGSGNYFLVEGCEYKKSFHNYSPQILVITNIETDHLDFYKDLEDIQNAFRELAEKVPEDGYVITNTKDENVLPVIKDLKCNVVDYKEFDLSDFNLDNLPGEYNLKNAQASFAVMDVLGAEKENIKKSIENFSGVWRRFEYKGENKNGAHVYDDYAHHPTEIQSFLKAVKGKFDKKVLAIFQPHLFSRTKEHLEDFAKSFGDADEVVILPIYKAREVDDGSISSADLVDKIDGARLIETFDEMAQYASDLSEEWVILTIGAGDIADLADKITS